VRFEFHGDVCEIHTEGDVRPVPNATLDQWYRMSDAVVDALTYKLPAARWVREIRDQREVLVVTPWSRRAREVVQAALDDVL
jgi:hypothetical protein